MLLIQAALFSRASRTFVGVTNGQIKTLEHTSDLVIVLDVSAVTGTSPTLDVVIEEYDPTTETYFVIDTFAQVIGTGTVRRTVSAVHGRLIRAVATIGGTTPDFTFAVGALAA